ncbi:glycoside hydrolase family 3 N-terminal domain-containing protein [Pseudoduganella chitinolytica]|uniref:beta-glucosidase n=1 Tax=Pseudoduganella chitinolytica TaxID=34070 RepID=A0ABY8B945_9BURK|nr:glycoside hydrolase family 3 N-terminal domain-containing protein [Pseudoduganella chitinolytica]WEF31578.1 glycoside hydrolase family 3 N-terminal domain-containing protein [Pseudoduganella chitinolytica]
MTVRSMAAYLLALLALPATAQAADAQVGARVEALLARMTLQEKIGQLNQLTGRAATGPQAAGRASQLADIRAGKVGSLLNVHGAAETRAMQALALQSRLKIPLLFGLDVIHGYKTVFPVPLGEAASWDLEAIEAAARIAAREAAAAGVHWTFAPMVDVGRDPRWGRVMEGAGEDPYLGAQIARARVRGFQGTKLGATDRVMATAKHFAAYGAAIAGRDYNAVDLSPQQLHEVYLPPFKAALDAGVATFMNSFNTLNGVPATGSSYLQRDILKGDWRFDGFVVSDWASVKEMVAHGYASDLGDAAVKAVNAGSDMDMEGEAYVNHLEQAVRDGKVDVKAVDDAVRRVLAKKFELGLFEDPYRFTDARRERAVLADASHRAVARDVAQKSIVLLKNERRTLPLAAGPRRIAVIGPLADSRRDLEGGWVVEDVRADVVTILAGIRARARGADVTYAQACAPGCASDAGFAQAVATAAEADVIVLAVGETWDMSGEAKSRTDLGLPGRQNELFAALKGTGRPIVAVLLGGRPLIFEDIANRADAILFAWFPGSEGGNAVANVLFGDYNPSARLPIGFPRSVGQLPLPYAQYATGRPVTDERDIVYRSAYIDSPNTPRYAFGHGLSYTTFAYSNLALDRPTLANGQTATLSFDLANTGPVVGTEIAQLYVRDLVASTVRPLKELKGFRKVTLRPGERQRVTFKIERDTLAFFDSRLRWVAEPGEFHLMVGSAADDIRLRGALRLREE